MRVKLVLVLVLLVMSVAVVHGADSPIVSSFLSYDGNRISSTTNQITTNYDSTVKALISIVEDKDVDITWGGPLTEAVNLLGKLRAKDAANALVGRIMLLPTDIVCTEMLPSQEYFVCAKALVDIGEPSIDAVMQRIRLSDNKSEREMAAWVIMSIEGRDQAIHRLQMLAAKEKQYRSRFVSAVDYLNNFKLTSIYSVSREMAQQQSSSVKTEAKKYEFGNVFLRDVPDSLNQQIKDSLESIRLENSISVSGVVCSYNTFRRIDISNPASNDSPRKILSRITPGIIPLIARYLTYTDDSYRLKVATAFTYLIQPDVVNPNINSNAEHGLLLLFRRSILDKDNRIRNVAAEALFNVGSRHKGAVPGEVIDGLNEVKLNDPDLSLREKASSYLSSLEVK